MFGASLFDCLYALNDSRWSSYYQKMDLQIKFFITIKQDMGRSETVKSHLIWFELTSRLISSTRVDIWLPILSKGGCEQGSKLVNDF